MSDPTRLLEQLTSGVAGLYSQEDLLKKLASGRQLRVKLGLDPTAPDLHLGHGVVLGKLRDFQDLGHKAVLIIGDYTARIGDPTGRDTTRPVLNDQEIALNAQTYLDQAGTVLDLSENRLEVRKNSEWLEKLRYADLLRLTGMVTVQQMLQRRSFKKRIEDEVEIMLSECMYPLMQAYDSVMVEADVEIGGTDQTFNNLMGREIQGKHDLERQVVVVLPILTGLDGQEKMSKSKGNTIGVTESPGEMFGKLMSISDAMMGDYFRLLTDLPEAEISTLLDSAQTHPREAKDRLGQLVVARFHDVESARSASEEFRQRFSGKSLPSDLETKVVSQSPIGVLVLLREVGFAKTNSEARRLVEQGAVSLGDSKITDPKTEFTIREGMILRVGKRRVCRLVLGS